MTGVRFYRDKNNTDKGWNGLATFPDDRIKRAGKTGWWGITASQESSGDGPYVDAKVSSNYVKTNCEKITEEAARASFPKLVKEVEAIHVEV